MTPCFADSFYWTNAAGGYYTNADNWSPASVPGTNDDVYFSLTSAVPYTVNFSAGITCHIIKVKTDKVIFDLGGNTVNVLENKSNPVGWGSVFVTRDSGEVGELTVSNGILYCTYRLSVADAGGKGTFILDGATLRASDNGFFNNGGGGAALVVKNGGYAYNFNGIHLGYFFPASMLVTGINSRVTAQGVTIKYGGSLTVADGAYIEAYRSASIATNSTLTLNDGTVKLKKAAGFGTDLANLDMVGGQLQGIGDVISSDGSQYGTLNRGAIFPGGTNAVGTISIMGTTYTNAVEGQITIELAGIQSNEYDRLVVDGTATLYGGTCTVSLINGFVPTFGDRFRPLQWTNTSGAFTTVNLPSLPGRRQWNTNDLYTTGEISVNTIPAGTVFSMH